MFQNINYVNYVLMCIKLLRPFSWTLSVYIACESIHKLKTFQNYCLKQYGTPTSSCVADLSNNTFETGLHAPVTSMSSCSKEDATMHKKVRSRRLAADIADLASVPNGRKLPLIQENIASFH